jgi:hypothetical protein
MACTEKRNITTKEAREILGEKYGNLSDDKLEQLLDVMYTLCEKTIKGVMEGKHGKEKVSDLL